MSSAKQGPGTLVLLVVVVALVGLAGWDQMRRHVKPPATATRLIQSDADAEADTNDPGAGLPVIIEGDSVGRAGSTMPKPAAADSTRQPDQMPAGEVMTI